MTNNEAAQILKEVKSAYTQSIDPIQEVTEAFCIAINVLGDNNLDVTHWEEYTNPLDPLFPTLKAFRCPNCGTISGDKTSYCSGCGCKMEDTLEHKRS